MQWIYGNDENYDFKSTVGQGKCLVIWKDYFLV